MEPLVLAAAAALMNAMGLDVWQKARSAVVALWRRVHPDRAETINAELAEVREEVVKARKAGDAAIEQALIGEWQGRFHRLLQRDPSVEEELQRTLDNEILPLLPPTEQQQIGSIMMKGRASGHGRVYQAGRDQHITER